MIAVPTRAGRLLLALDAAPGVGSVALVTMLDGGEPATVVSARAVAMRAPPKHAGHAAPPPDDDPLMLALVALLEEAGVAVRSLAGVACGAGPGGFTSLRIAAALAKGIAHGAGCPLLSAPSLAWAAAVRAPAPGRWLVTLDALRGEHYVAAVTLVGAGERTRRVTSYEYLGVHTGEALRAVGSLHGAAEVLEIGPGSSAAPIAAGAVALAPTPVDLARWEPVYGRLAEAQVRWEETHGPLPADPPPTDASSVRPVVESR